ncbi:hypothetical protein CEXT_679331 [Caerostris extrusa]|uniref:Uncharacterized protein n=1 Tax=Caerostris extrusa TaxID=172846 RepID=A0AAV4SLM2_CAEEX|nr:hypothetical protein CEXT_679331 [Caerostris extrusa]
MVEQPSTMEQSPHGTFLSRGQGRTRQKQKQPPSFKIIWGLHQYATRLVRLWKYVHYTFKIMQNISLLVAAAASFLEKGGTE